MICKRRLLTSIIGTIAVAALCLLGIEPSYAQSSSQKEPVSPVCNSTTESKTNNNPKNYIFSSDWFSRNIPIWSRVLAPLQGRPNINYLEIGVHEGRSFISVLESILTAPTAKATAIDIFPGDLEQRFLENIRKSGFADKVTVIKGTSRTKLRELPLNSFDLIYVDGSHVAHDVLLDAVLCWDLLKTGGIMIFDDYALKKGLVPPALRPQIAIDSFLSSFRNFIKILHQGWQVIIVKIENPCIKHAGGDYNVWKDCSPIGNYMYYWGKQELYDVENYSPINISNDEASVIENLINSRDRSDVLKSSSYEKLNERLKFDFN